MSDTAGLILVAAVAVVVLSLLFRHARAVDLLEAIYRERIQDHHPGIALDRKRGAVQYLVIEGVAYPSSVVDFRARCKREPERVNDIIDEYLASIPTRYMHLGKTPEAG